MKINLSFQCPTWLLPKRLLEDLKRRSSFNGKASREWSDKRRILTVSASAERTEA